MDWVKNKENNTNWYIPPEYVKTDRKCSDWRSLPENCKNKWILESEISQYLSPTLFCVWDEKLICSYWAIQRHSDHLLMSVKMIIGYIDSLFQESRSIMKNPSIYNIMPDMLKQRYSELEYQYSYVERKELNFYNIMTLKRHIENVTKNVTLVGQKYANSLRDESENSNCNNTKTNNHSIVSVKNSNLEESKDLNISIKVKKEKLDWDFSELILDPSQLKDREVMDDLWKYRLIKVSKIKLIYTPDYLDCILTFMRSIHHVSEFTLTSRDQNECIEIDNETINLLCHVYLGTYEQFEIIGINLKEDSYKLLGEAFNKNRNNLTVNIKSWNMNDTSVAYFFNSILLKPRILFLQYLWLSNNNIKDSGATIVSVWIQYFEYLNVLDLRKNLIGDNGIRSISKSFKHMTRAVQVYLSDNVMTKKGAKYIMKNLHYLKSLINLDLSGNQLKDSGVEFIIRNVTKEKRELMITLKNNEIEDIEAIKDIIEEEDNKKFRISNLKIFIE